MRGIGASTYCMMEQSLSDALEALSVWTDCVEILSDARHSLFDHAEIAASFDLQYTVHAPTADLNVASDIEAVRRATLRVLADLAEVCDQIGAGVLVVHPGICLEPHLMRLSERALRRSLYDLSRLQEECAVTLAVENMGSWPCCHFRDTALLPLLADLDLGFVLDVGHAHLNGNLEEFCRLGDPVHLHLHDNDGRTDLHAACGIGGIDFLAVMEAVPSRATAVVEVGDARAVRPSLDYLNRL
ncbi:sugar phosphate isomerase/epimerase family protein [Methanofollis fontis]|uniref:Sugar phosphate isomerase/epimerase n=1 Tax=Methanofollis fontis TaxID=2052832 RepID=A0A483CQ39_9EURY|nr:TIM barrel protein [Methanofollis fontis]TAJ45233.1 sugar phosphate isomerase/epimerase [Methanofollis fontis]